MNVLVTGANGLLATNIIVQLLAQDYGVTGLIRDPRKFLLPAHPKLQLIPGDITDSACVMRVAANCDYIIHCAASTSQNLLRYADYSLINVTGTEHIIQAAIANGIKRVVYVGTANTFGYGSLTTPGDETLPPREPFASAWYAKSKLEGQYVAMSATGNIEVVVVSPTFMLGPYDSKPSSGAIIRMGYGKRVVFHPPGGKNFVHVDDVARGTVEALTAGKSGEAYLLAGENLSYRQFFSLLAQQTNQRTLLVCLPKLLLIGIGYIGDLLRTIGIKTALSSTNMKILCVHNYYTNRKAREELHISFRPVAQAIDDAVDWFKKQKML
ncbi:NAD-dependent epimerase/dehydratase family protein [Parapedobacter lycopersici]|uniref:NAD-dependent epimerase/dehydratase family protein n=1 Tax=Parapedobacter lycopersici TaxID=1864939 RepID=UPI0033423FF6